MWIPQENKEGYEAGNAMNFAKNLRGRLLLYYGTADNNVHPNNSMQLIHALQQAGKSFELQVGPGSGAQRREPSAHDGVLHREPRHAAGAPHGTAKITDRAKLNAKFTDERGYVRISGGVSACICGSLPCFENRTDCSAKPHVCFCAALSGLSIARP